MLMAHTRPTTLRHPERAADHNCSVIRPRLPVTVAIHMTPKQRPLNSGRVDSLGRAIRVSGNTTETRSDAPAPNQAPSEAFSRFELDAMSRAGVDAATAERFASNGICQFEAIATWHAAGYNPTEAAELRAAGSAGGAAPYETPDRLDLDHLAALTANTTLNTPRFGTAHATTRNWAGNRKQVSATIGHGLPGFDVVGAPSGQVRELRDRVRAAIISSGFEWPTARITINRGDHGDSQSSSRQDAAIAVTILEASGQIERPDRNAEIWGELNLDGRIRDVDR